MSDETSRKLSRAETHDLGMIIKDRTKVLRSFVAERAAVVLADFESKMAAVYSFDQDEVWEKATAEAMKVAAESQSKIAERCKELGIPPTFAPSLTVVWHGRGENALAQRRAELRVMAKARIDAMSKAAITKIERTSLALRTQVVGMAIMSPDAKMFFESLAPIDESMHALEFRDIEVAMIESKQDRRRRFE